MNTGREMDCGIANHIPLEKLVAVAFQFGLLDDWRYTHGCIHLNVGIMGVTLTADDARTLLQALIRRHYLAHSNHNGAESGRPIRRANGTEIQKRPPGYPQEPF